MPAGWGKRTLAFLVTYALAMFIALHAPILSGMNLGFGDRADGLIEISILEHWRGVFSGADVGWRQTPYFYPHRDTLGYNDGYFLFGLVFSLWRQWFDPFLSDTLNIATWKTIGFCSSYWLVTRGLRWERPVALLVALLFVIANGMAVQAGHAQLQAVALLPLAALLLLLLIDAETGRQSDKAAFLAIILAALLGLWLLTGFYFAFFTLLFAFIFLLCWTWNLGADRSEYIHRNITLHWRTAIIFGFSFALALIPFLFIYIPKLGETGGHSYEETRQYLVTIFDVANVGPDNLLWGWFFEWLARAANALTSSLGFDLAPGWIIGEHETGFPFILLGLIFSAFWAALRRGSEFSTPFRLFALALAISWLLTINLGYLSPWGIAYFLLPGAKGVRVILRYQLWLILPVLILCAGVWRARFMSLLSTRPFVAGLLILVLIGEQWTGATAAELNRTDQLTDLAKIAPMPTACPAFYVVSARPYNEYYRNADRQAHYPHNVDAMLLASLWRKPTINGFSTFNPPDWDFARPNAPDYDARVARYARKHGLPVLCRLDARQTPQWRIIRYTHGETAHASASD